ncbi:MAG TPA: thioredoxin domain-containing protein [Gemmatimonadota bacterium]|nr:thioredoxin domain-containing protein [Gemmatimonadota bacterium]
MSRICVPLLGLLLWAATPAAAQEPPVAQDVPLIQSADAARMFGPDSAAYTLTEFIDFACTTCRSFQQVRADSLKAFVEANDLHFTLRVYPIPRLMRGFQAAEAVFCAAAFTGQEGLLGMVDQLFQYHDVWRLELDPTPIFERFAENVGAPMPSYRSCVARDAMAPLIINDVRIAREAEITGTPSFVFNRLGEFNGNVKFYGNQPMSDFIESLRVVKEGPASEPPEN